MSEEALPEAVSPAADGAAAMDAAVKEFLERRTNTGKNEISTGLKALDRAIIGFRPKMYVVAARPAMGKTALSGTIRRAVINQGYVWLTFNLEMDKNEMCEREIAYQANLNLRRIMSAKEATDDEAKRVRESPKALNYGLWRVYDSCFTMADIEAAALAEKAAAEKKGLKIGGFDIDYLQLLGDTANSRQESVSACSRKCKLLTKKLNAGGLILSQLNRGCEYRDDKRPLASDLRESGAIEQDADVILMLYREHVYNPLADPYEAEAILRKQRSGPIGPVRLRFDARTTTFSDPPPVINVVTPEGVQ